MQCGGGGGAGGRVGGRAGGRAGGCVLCGRVGSAYCVIRGGGEGHALRPRAPRVTSCLHMSLSHASTCHALTPPRVTLSRLRVSLSHASMPPPSPSPPCPHPRPCAPLLCNRGEGAVDYELVWFCGLDCLKAVAGCGDTMGGAVTRARGCGAGSPRGRGSRTDIYIYNILNSLLMQQQRRRVAATTSATATTIATTTAPSPGVRHHACTPRAAPRADATAPLVASALLRSRL